MQSEETAKAGGAGELLRQVLNLSDLPPEVACALLLSENVRVDQTDRSIALRFHTIPLEGMNHRETAYLAADQVRKILRPRLSSPLAELRFLDELDRGDLAGPVQLFALWRARAEEIREAALRGLEERRVFLLLHDSAGKQTTVEALPGIIEAYRAAGFSFDRLTVEVTPVVFGYVE